jgi:hypothetical protein
MPPIGIRHNPSKVRKIRIRRDLRSSQKPRREAEEWDEGAIVT